MASVQIYGTLRERIIDVPCSYPQYGSADVLVMYTPEGATPTQVQIQSAYGHSVYARIQVVCLNSADAVLSEHDVVQGLGSTNPATARTVGFVRKITLPVGTVKIGVDLVAWASNYQGGPWVWRNYSPRSLTVLNAKK